jgi:integrase/recombinase XerD
MRRRFRDDTVTLTNIRSVRDRKGRIRRYLQVKGQPLIPLPDLPVSDPEFIAAWAEAMKQAKGKQPARAGTLAHLITAFLKSPGYLCKSAAYRAVIGRHLALIEGKGGHAYAADLRQGHIKADLARLAPAVAQARLKAWRLLCAYGADVNAMRANPSDGIAKPRLAPSAGHEPWLRDEVDAFRARWPIGTVQRAIFEMLHWTGCRIGDAVRVGPGMVNRSGVLVYRQAKTGDDAFCPWTCPLPAFADHADRDMMHQALLATRGQMTFLATRDGRPRSAKAIGGDVSKAARLAGVQKSAHGLRKTRAIALAEGGASALEIGAWTGHQSLGEIAHYTRGFERMRAVMGTEQVQNVGTHPDPVGKHA